MSRIFTLLSCIPWIIWFVLDINLKAMLYLPLLTWIATWGFPELQPALRDVIPGLAIGGAVSTAAVIWLVRDTRARRLPRAGIWVPLVMVAPIFGCAVYARTVPPAR